MLTPKETSTQTTVWLYGPRYPCSKVGILGWCWGFVRCIIIVGHRASPPPNRSAKLLCEFYVTAGTLRHYSLLVTRYTLSCTIPRIFNLALSAWLYAIICYRTYRTTGRFSTWCLPALTPWRSSDRLRSDPFFRTS